MTIMSEYTSTKTLMGLSFTALFIALGLFGAALFLPVFITEDKVILGYWVVATGWLGFIGFQFAWYANAFALFVLYFARSNTLFALFLSVITLLIASQAYLFTEIPYSEKSQIVDYGKGFYVWYFSFYFITASVLLRLIANRALKHNKEKQQQQMVELESKEPEDEAIVPVVTTITLADKKDNITLKGDTSLPPLLPVQKKVIPPPLPINNSK